MSTKKKRKKTLRNVLLCIYFALRERLFHLRRNYFIVKKRMEKKGHHITEVLDRKSIL